MTFPSNEFNSCVTELFTKLARAISEKYNLDSDIVINYILSKSRGHSTPSPINKKLDRKSPENSFDEDDLKLKTIPELKEMCKDRSIKYTGKKDDLVERLLGFKSGRVKPDIKIPKPTKGRTADGLSSEIADMEITTSRLVKKVSQGKSGALKPREDEKLAIVLRRDKFFKKLGDIAKNYYLIQDENIVVEKISDGRPKAVAKLEDEELKPLSKEDLRRCVEWKIDVIITEKSGESKSKKKDHKKDPKKDEKNEGEGKKKKK